MRFDRICGHAELIGDFLVPPAARGIGENLPLPIRQHSQASSVLIAALRQGPIDRPRPAIGQERRDDFFPRKGPANNAQKFAMVGILENISTGASLDGRPFTGFSPAVAYSFYPTKNLPCLGDGGAVLTDSSNVASRLRLLRDGGRRGDQVARVPAINARLDEMQACYLRAFLPKLSAWNAGY